MIVGDNVTVFVDDEAGSQTGLFEFRPTVRSEKLFRRFLKGLLSAKGVHPKWTQSRPAGLDRFFHPDVDDGRADSVGQAAEIFRNHRYRAFGLAFAIRNPDTNSSPVIITMMIDRVNLIVRVMFLVLLCDWFVVDARFIRTVNEWIPTVDGLLCCPVRLRLLIR